MQNSNNNRRVTSGSHTVDVRTQTQNLLDTFCVPTGHGVVKKALFPRKLCVYMLSFQRLFETTKILFLQQRENVIRSMEVICEIKAEGILFLKIKQTNKQNKPRNDYRIFCPRNFYFYDFFLFLLKPGLLLFLSCVLV